MSNLLEFVRGAQCANRFDLRPSSRRLANVQRHESIEEVIDRIAADAVFSGPFLFTLAEGVTLIGNLAARLFGRDAGLGASSQDLEDPMSTSGGGRLFCPNISAHR
jgi:hypothetical protein